jgi:hypothetical protein
MPLKGNPRVFAACMPTQTYMLIAMFVAIVLGAMADSKAHGSRFGEVLQSGLLGAGIALLICTAFVAAAGGPKQFLPTAQDAIVTSASTSDKSSAEGM